MNKTAFIPFIDGLRHQRFNVRTGNQVSYFQRPLWYPDSVPSPVNGPESVPSLPSYHRLYTRLERHCIPNLRTLTVPPDIVGFRTRIQQKHVDQTNDNQDPVSSFIYDDEHEILSLPKMYRGHTSRRIARNIYLRGNDRACCREPKIHSGQMSARMMGP